MASNLRMFPVQPIPRMTTVTALDALRKAHKALGDPPDSAAVNVAKARIEEVIQFIDSEIFDCNTRGL